MEFIFSGFIEVGLSDDRNFTTLKLRQADGLKIDLIYRLSEIVDSFGRKVAVSYFITDHVCTRDEAMIGFLDRIEGNAEAEYSTNAYSYSEYTRGVDYTTCLSVGGHSLLGELSGKVGNFCILVIEPVER